MEPEKRKRIICAIINILGEEGCDSIDWNMIHLDVAEIINARPVTGMLEELSNNKAYHAMFAEQIPTNGEAR